MKNSAAVPSGAVGETAFEKFHPALLCRSTRRVMSSRTLSVLSSQER